MDISGVTPYSPVQDDPFAVLNNEETGAPDTEVTAPSPAGDTVTLSPMAAALAPMAAAVTGASADPLDPTAFSDSAATGKVGNVKVSYNNANGSVTWNSITLNLKDIVNTRDSSTNVVFQQDGNVINVYVDGAGGSSSYQLSVFDGSQIKDANKDPLAATGALDTTKAALYIGNTSAGVTGGNGNDMIINRADGATIDGGAGNDKIFNFAKNNVTINSGTGQDAVFTVGLTGGSITTGGGASVTSTGNLTNVDITMDGTGDNSLSVKGNLTGNGSTSVAMKGSGTNRVNVTGNISDVKIADTAASKGTSVIAKSVTNAASVTDGLQLLGQTTGLKVTTLNSNVIMGDGENQLVTDTVGAFKITNGGMADFSFKTLNGTSIDGSDATDSMSITVTGSAKDSSFDFGSGKGNTLNAAGKTLTSVSITDKAGAETTVIAGSITGTSAARSTVALKGHDDNSSTVVVTGAVKYSDIDTGAGTGTVQAGSVSDSTIKMDTAGTHDQTVYIKGTVTNSTLDTGKGDDTVTVGGTVNGGNFKLSEGDDTLTIGGAVSGGSEFDLDKGDDTVTIAGAVSNTTVKLGDGTNSFSAVKNTTYQAMTNVDITASGTGATTIKGGAYKTGAGASGTGNVITLGDGPNVIELTSISGSTGKELKITMGDEDGDKDQTLIVNGNVSNATVSTGAATDTVTIKGSVSNSSFALGKGTNTFEASKQNSKGQAIYQAMTNVNITASGSTAADATTIKGGAYKTGAGGNEMSLGDGANVIELTSISGSAGNELEITMGAADKEEAQTFTVNGNISNTSVSTGKGNDTMTIKGSVSGNTTINTGDGGDDSLIVEKTVKGLTYTGADGKDDITIKGVVSDSEIDLGDGDSTVLIENDKGVAQAMTNVNVTSGTGDVTLTGGDYKATKSGIGITLGDGENTVTLRSVSGSSTSRAAFSLGGGGTSQQTLTVSGAAKDFTYTGADGIDVLNFKGAITNALIELGKGANTLEASTTNSKGAIIYQAMNNVDITAGDGGTTIKAGAYKSGAGASDTGNYITLGNGENTVELSSITGYKNGRLDMTLGGTASTDTTLTVSGAVKGLSYTGSEFNDKVAINGSVTDADFALGAGENTLSATVKDKSDVDRGQALSNVDISADDGSTNVINYGTFKPGTLGNTWDLGTAKNTINILA